MDAARQGHLEQNGTERNNRLFADRNSRADPGKGADPRAIFNEDRRLRNQSRSSDLNTLGIRSKDVWQGFVSPEVACQLYGYDISDDGNASWRNGAGTMPRGTRSG